MGPLLIGSLLKLGGALLLKLGGLRIWHLLSDPKEQLRLQVQGSDRLVPIGWFAEKLLSCEFIV